MLAYILLRGGKKLSQLQLVKPNGAISGIKRNTTASIFRGVEND